MGSIHRSRAHSTYWLLYKPLLFRRALKWIQVLGLGAAGNHPHSTPSWGFASPALHGPSQQPQCSGLSFSFLCPQPRVPPEHTSAFAGSLGSLCAPSRHPTPTTQLPSPLEPPPIATACPSRLAGHPSPSEGYQARVELQEETRSHSSTPSVYREPGLVTWEGGSLGPASPYHSQFCKYCHCFVGSGPTKSSRSRVGFSPVVLTGVKRAKAYPQIPAHLAATPPPHPPLPWPGPSTPTSASSETQAREPWWGLRRQELQVLLGRKVSVVN